MDLERRTRAASGTRYHFLGTRLARFSAEASRNDDPRNRGKLSTILRGNDHDEISNKTKQTTREFERKAQRRTVVSLEGPEDLDSPTRNSHGLIVVPRSERLELRAR